MSRPENSKASADARKLVGYRLQFPRGLESERVASFLSGLTGMLPRWWKRWLGVPFIVIETHATTAGVEHFLLAPSQWAPAIENMLQASLPGVRFEPVEVPTPDPMIGAEYQLTSSARALRIDAASMATKLLTNLQPLHKHESIVVQWLIAPANPAAPARLASKAERDRVFQPAGTVRSAEALAGLKAKQSSALLVASGRVGVTAATDGRAGMLLRHVELAWAESRAPGVVLRRRTVRHEAVARRIGRRVVPLTAWPSTYNVDELTGLVGWPIEAIALPGVVLGGCRLLPASPAVPRTGTVMAESNFPGNTRPLAVDVEARLRHVAITGPTGTGKSTLLTNMAVQDMNAGYGVVLLDPKGDLVSDVLARVPRKRLSDVIVFDPADHARPVGLNPLQSTVASAEVVVENLLGTFKSLYRGSWGPRTDDIMRAAMLTLASTGDATLADVPMLLTDPGFRRRIVSQIDDPIGLEPFWGWYESISEAEKMSVVGPVLNKVRAFTMRPRVRAIVGQAHPALNFKSAINDGKIVLVSLASGLLGTEAAALLGALIVSELWHATTARASTVREHRQPVMAYLDEFQHFLHLPTPMAEVLAEARGFGLGLTLAHQTFGQLAPDQRDAVLANARSRVVFQLPSGDARLVAREMGGLLDADDLQGIGAYEVVTQLYARGATQPPATGKSMPSGPITSDPTALRARSRELYGADHAEVDAAIQIRHTGPTAKAPVGRRRRTTPPSKDEPGGGS